MNVFDAVPTVTMTKSLQLAYKLRRVVERVDDEADGIHNVHSMGLISIKRAL